MADNMNIQWFPGHMAKTKRIIEKNLSLVDIIIEILDARAPVSSSNPDLYKIIKNKPRLIIFNKSDLADQVITDKWNNYYKNKNLNVLNLDSRSGRGVNKVHSLIFDILKDLINKRINKGMTGTPVRAMIVGIPNVGKSSFINRMAKKKKTKVEDRPGVTRGKQWVDTGEGLEFLDMPGVLAPKFEDDLVGKKLAFLGSIKDNILDIEYLATELLNFLFDNYKELVVNRYKINEKEIDFESPYGLLEYIGKKRGMFVSGGEINLERASMAVLDEFRSGKIGKISLEVPKEYI